jgi:hypothetical protein
MTCLTFDEIKRLVDQQYQLACRTPRIAPAIRKYSNAVEATSPRTWQVAGLYSYLSQTERLVLEALHLRRADTCVVRVYFVQPLRILLARKSEGDVQKLAADLGYAREQFILHLPPAPDPVVSFEPDSELDVSLAFLPIPPPVNLAEIQE